MRACSTAAMPRSDQIRQAASMCLSVSCTIDRATPRRRAISRVGTPPTNFRLQCSLPALGFATLAAKVADSSEPGEASALGEQLPSVWSTKGERLKSERLAASSLNREWLTLPSRCACDNVREVDQFLILQIQTRERGCARCGASKKHSA
jgi:hypothetical protein